MAEKRLHYYDQQFLQEPDFTQEQLYHIGKRRRHNDKLHGHGLVEGLDVSKRDNRNATVAAGMALDSAGKEIFIDTPEDVAIPATPKTTFIITVTYNEELTDPPPPEFQISPIDRTRVTEKPQFPVFKQSDSFDVNLNIPLAEVRTNNSGNITTVDNSIKDGQLVPTGEEIREARGLKASLGERLEATFDIETDYPFKNIVWINSFIGRQSNSASKFLTLINQNLMSKNIRIRGYVEGATSGGFIVAQPRNGFGTNRLSFRSGTGDQIWVFYSPKIGTSTTNLLFVPDFRCTRTVANQSRLYRIQLDFRNNKLACRVLGFMPATTGSPPFGITGGARVVLEIAWR